MRYAARHMSKPCEYKIYEYDFVKFSSKKEYFVVNNKVFF